MLVVYVAPSLPWMTCWEGMVGFEWRERERESVKVCATNQRQYITTGLM